MCEAYRAATHFGESGHRVNLLFDHETDAIRVESPYTHDALRITLKKPGPLFVRLPPWAECAPPPTTPPVGQPVTIRFPLRDEQITLSDRVHPRPIRVTLRGDTVVAMESRGAPLSFFPDLP